MIDGFPGKMKLDEFCPALFGAGQRIAFGEPAIAICFVAARRTRTRRNHQHFCGSPRWITFDAMGLVEREG